MILKSYIPDKLELKTKIQEIADIMSGTNFHLYELDSKTSLIFVKDERDLKNLKRYNESPFPLLSNLEWFCCAPGTWDQSLQDYGIKTRSKYRSDLPNTGSILIHMIYSHTPSGRANRYLKRQYKLLELYRKTNMTKAYWHKSWVLMSKSWSYKIASFNQWHNRWYKDLNLKQIHRILRPLKEIISLEQRMTTIRNLWIESPRGKYRQLGIPPLSWRLYLHMLNQFISYIYEPRLDPAIYDGFIYNRGCLSWWTKLLWSPVLEDMEHLMELDFSSGFPNMNLHSVVEQ